MPRKAKEKINELNMETTKLTDVVGEKKVNKTKSSTEKKPTKTRTKKVFDSKVTTITKESAKKTSTAKLKSTKKATATKKSTTARTSANKSTKKSKTATKKVTKSSTITTEYYDLPFRYNQTIVKILAQTPNTLFIYWDISDMDRQSYLEKYGTDFFEATKPYLIITNVTMHYTFEVEINDFANSWYLHIDNANCEYKVELGRKFITNSNHPSVVSANSKSFEPYSINDYLYITSSNEIEAPNDRILFDKLGSTVFFRNVKTNVTNKQDISSLSFLQKIGKVYNIYDLYKEIYRDELISDEFELNLPSSNSSSFK